MKLQMHSIHFDADKKLLDFIQKKVDKLETFHDRIVNGEVILKIDNDEERENKVIEIKLFIPGNMLFAKEQSKTFEAAADVVVETMKRQLKKYKEKQTH
jgi:putative sigma-54 modulation protein